MVDQLIRVAHKRGHLNLRKLDHADGLECERCGMKASSGSDGRLAGELLTRSCGTPSGTSFDYGVTWSAFCRMWQAIGRREIRDRCSRQCTSRWPWRRG